METLEVPLLTWPSKRVFAARLRAAAAESGLRIALVTDVAGYPGAMHWHIVSPGSTGTLELTYWPEKTKLWFKIHARRRGAWMVGVIPALSAALTRT